MHSDEEKLLFGVEVPIATSSYSPVSHRMIIEASTGLVDLLGYPKEEVSKEYTHASEGREMSAVYTLGAGSDKRVLMFQNSYNKRMALKFAFGIDLDGTRVVGSEIGFKRKHTGAIGAELEELVESSKAFLTDTYDDILASREFMMAVNMGPVFSSGFIGELFINKDILTGSQVIFLKNRINKIFATGIPAVSLWEVYSLIASALKKTHASKQIDGYMDLYRIIRVKFGIL